MILFLIFDIFMNIYVHLGIAVAVRRWRGGGVNDYCSTMVGTIEILINFTF